MNTEHSESIQVTCLNVILVVESSQLRNLLETLLGMMKGGSKKSIALDQTGYGAVQRVHLGPLNRTFPARYFPGSALSVENHCFGPSGQSASFRHGYPAKKKCQT